MSFILTRALPSKSAAGFSYFARICPMNTALFHSRAAVFSESFTPVSPATNATTPSSPVSSSAPPSASSSAAGAASTSTVAKPKSFFGDPANPPKQVKSPPKPTSESAGQSPAASIAASSSSAASASKSFLGNLFRGTSNNNNKQPGLSSPPPPPFTSASPPQAASKQPSSSRVESVSNVGFTLLIGVLIYFAIDNYHARLILQDEMFEKTLKQQKALAIAQASFKNARDKREMQMLNERKNTQKREMKMALHIALLRQQLKDAGIDPVDINFANKEFEKNVKMENSLANLTGTSLWVVDEADIKKYMPNTHDYDNRNGK